MEERSLSIHSFTLRDVESVGEKGCDDFFRIVTTLTSSQSLSLTRK
jgi:hypothetical protein